MVNFYHFLSTIIAMRYLIPFVLVLAVSCSSQKKTGTETFSQNEAETVVKETMLLAAKRAIAVGKKKGSYTKNKRIRIPFPRSADKMRRDMIKYGYRKKINKYLNDMNVSAEESAGKTFYFFRIAVERMDIKDPVKLLNAKSGSIIDYMYKQEKEYINYEYYGIIRYFLKSTKVKTQFNRLLQLYSNSPYAKKVNINPRQYATDMGLKGLLTLMKDQEKLIRRNPAKRTSDEMKKVYGILDKKRK
jgi:hypothetical protein